MSYDAARETVDDLIQRDVVARIWRRDVSVWAAEPKGEVGRAIANRLGWLDLPTTMAGEIPRVEALADGVREEGITHVYLLGMGGSSLCAEVLRCVSGDRDG